jgi:hypothetical protein
MLHERDARTLHRARRWQRRMLGVGALLFLLGALYMLWAVDRVHSVPASAEPDAFDRPVAALARLLQPAQERLAQVRPITQLEGSLLEQLKNQTDVNGRLMLLVLRLLVGSVVATAGLALLATALARWPLLGIFRRLGI